MKKVALIVSIAVLGLLGCTNRDQQQERTSQSSPPAQTTTGGQAMTDADRALAENVERALKQDQSLASVAQDIQVQAHNGEVTLQGSVSSEQEKANIGSKAQEVAGVTKVDNQLEVSSASR